MQNYRYEKMPDRTFQVKEMKTEYIMSSGMEYQAAKDMAKRLNGGMGFGGWTPAFFLIRPEISVNENA